MATLLGRFVWYELLTTDPEGAAAFYPRVTGWGTQSWVEGYTMWMVGGGEVPMGGFMTLPEEAKAAGAPSHWLGTITTPEVDATVARAVELGGSIIKDPFDIPDVGRLGIVADPQGAIIELLTPLTESPLPDPEKDGFVSWHELATTDPVAGFGFYAELLGWQKAGDFDMGPMGTYQLFGYGEAPVGGIFRKPPHMAGPSAWLYYVRVPSADQAAEQAKAAGAQVLNGPMEVPGGDRIAVFMDPQGAVTAVHSRAGQ